MESWWMHRRLYRDISAELPSQSQLFKDFEQAIPLTPTDKAGHNNSAQELLDVFEARGQIGLGNYELLLKLLRETQLIKVLHIAERHIGQIMKQLSVENETSVNLAERTSEPCEDYFSSKDQTKISDRTETIQRELQDWYIDTLSRLRPLQWCDWLEVDLDHVFTNLVMVAGTKYQLGSRSNFDCDDITMLNRLFNADSSKRSVSFIEGPAGIGKSTLCRHLAYLWSKNNYSIGNHSFGLLFLLEAKSLTGDLKKSINEQLFPKDFELSEDNIYECIRNRHKKSLLIIDGIDELSSEGKTTVMELLKGEKLRHVNLLLTGRPEASLEFIKYAKSHLKITGFSFENIKEYICKYFGSNDNKYKDMLLDRLDVDDELQNIMENPFTTLLVCILVKDKKGDIPANLIDILNLVLQARCQNYITNQEGSGNLISEGNLLSAAGHLAYEGLKHGITAYHEDTLTSFCTDGFSGHLLKSGILSKDFTVSRLHTKCFCYFPHKSFQEFLCAKYLAELDLEKFKETLQPLCFNLNINMLRFFLRIVQCQVKAQLLLEFICKKTNKNWSNAKGFAVLEVLIDSCQNKDLLAQIICTYFVSLRLFTSNFLCLKHKSEEFFTKIILKIIKLPPVVIVSRLLTISPVSNDTSRSVVKLTHKLSNSTVRIMQFPRHLEVNAFDPSFLYQQELLHSSWNFVHCCSMQDANDVLTTGVKVGVLTILLVPGWDSVKDITALINSLNSAKNIAAVLFLVVEDVDNGYEDAFLRMLSLFTSLQNILFLKLRCSPLNAVVFDKFNRHLYGNVSKAGWCNVFDSSIIQMVYSKYCPY